jgi:tellurite resistance protein TerC
LELEAGFAFPRPVESNVSNDSTIMTPCARNEQSIGSPSWVQRLSGIWSTENIKIARRVIVSVVGATVLLIGVALLVLPGPAFIVIPIGLAILATEYAWARRWLKKVRGIANNVVSSRSRTTREDSGV